METKLIPPKVCCTLMLPNELDKREEIFFYTGKKMSIACLPSIQMATNHLHVMYIIYFCTILFQLVLLVWPKTTSLFRNKRFSLNEMIQRNASEFAIIYV